MLRRTAAKEKEQAQEDLRDKIAHACFERTKIDRLQALFLNYRKCFFESPRKVLEFFVRKTGMNPVCSSMTNKKRYLSLTVHFKGVHILND